MTPTNLFRNSALLLVDIQNDFLPGGALAVPDGDAVVPVAVAAVEAFTNHGPVIATRDYHPKGHASFASTHGATQFSTRPLVLPNGKTVDQMMWPDHCVQDTYGARLHRLLERASIHNVFKGTDPEVDSYSAFFDNGRIHATTLDEQLRCIGVDTLYVMGLATDYCVKYTVLDALELGYKVFVVPDGCRGVSNHAAAMAQMVEAGAGLVRL